MKNLSSSALLALFILLPTVALAVDGLLEINQICADQLGCFAGDTAGYPVAIDGSAGTSYRLTSDLIVPDEFTDGIAVSAPNISIDLNGFSIIRAPCVGQTLNCAPVTGTGFGVNVTDGSYAGVSVRNGSVIGMGSVGVLLQGGQNEARGLRVRSNRQDGIWANVGAVVIGNMAAGNGRDGIFVGGGTANDNSVWNNFRHGIFLGDGVNATNNTAYFNTGNGITAGQGSFIGSNSVYNNGGDGIVTGGGNAVQHNTVRANTGFGLRLLSNDAYLGNVITGNGNTVANGFNMGSNFCNTNATCP